MHGVTGEGKDEAWMSVDAEQLEAAKQAPQLCSRLVCWGCVYWA